MKNWLKFATALFIGAFIFTACESEVTLTVPDDVTIELGDSFDPMEGVSVSGANLEDVTVLENPAFSNVLVNHYVFSYIVDGESAQRNVYVSSSRLAGSYAVEDAVDGGGTINYTMTVTQSTVDFNRLLISNFLGFGANFQGQAIVEGTAVTVPRFTPSGWDPAESIEATGTYDGETRRLLTLSYTIIELDPAGGDNLVTTGTATLTKQ